MTESTLKYAEHLNPTQISLVNQAIVRARDPTKRGTLLTPPMGSGKTRIALMIGLNLYDKFLIIASKSLISSWVEEIHKIWPTDAPKYELVHRDYLGVKRMETWTPDADTRIIITTPQVILASYQENDIANFFVGSIPPTGRKRVEQDCYYLPRRPWRSSNNTGVRYMHSVAHQGIIIDECQNYTNIETHTARALASLLTPHRFLLSGTPLSEPSLNRVLGLFLLLNQYHPNTLGKLEDMMARQEFKGFDAYTLTCEAPVIEAKLHTIRHIYDMSPSEVKIYQFFQEIVTKWLEYYEMVKSSGLVALTDKERTERLRKIRGNLLSVLCYIRIGLVSPRDGINALVSKIEREEFLTGLDETITDLKPFIREACSHNTRLDAVCDVIIANPDNRVIIFSNFVQTLEAARLYIKKHQDINDRNLYLYHNGLSMLERASLLNEYREDPTGIIFLTYSIGSEGINLQCANIVCFLDPYWNNAKEVQGVARSYRQGQTRDVYQYHFTSNTNYEFAVLNKQLDKADHVSDILNGSDSLTGKFKTTSISYMEMAVLIARENLEELCKPGYVRPKSVGRDSDTESIRSGDTHLCCQESLTDSPQILDPQQINDG